MNETFFPQHFFDLMSCGFSALFAPNAPAWEALKKIIPYIESLKTFEILSSINTPVFFMNKQQIAIGKNCKIGPFVTIEGPCVIGDNVEIGPHAFIRAFSLIDRGAKVGHASEVKHSIVGLEAKLPHFNYVGDSILGQSVNLGAGVVCANFKTNKKEVWIKHENQLFETGLKKFGAIIGDNAFLGCNSVTNPGAILKKGFQCSPCTNIKGIFL